ncbi:MAG: response regulator [Bacillota bacterium]|nr:response regulator [Bacillota bacterium]
MNHKLLIADDRTIILDGLAKLVDWPSLGFELVGSCRNGQEVIDYIDRHSVDVILTDIKMPVLSGLDIARYVSENRLPIVVVLISAFKDFQLAREAIQHQVRWYLLKPTKLHEIKAVFSEIKLQLDEAQKQNAGSEDDLEDSGVDDILERQFHIDLYWGALRDEKAVSRRLAELSLPETLMQAPGCLFSIQMRPGSEHDGGEVALLQRYMQAYTETLTDQGKVAGKIHLIHFTDQRIQYMATFAQETSPDEITRLLQAHIQVRNDELESLFGVTLQLDLQSSYSNIAQYLMNSDKHQANPQMNRQEDDPYRNDARSVDACIQQIAHYLQEEKTDFAINLMHQLLSPVYMQAPGRLPVFAAGFLYRVSELITRAVGEAVQAADAFSDQLVMPNWETLKSTDQIMAACNQALTDFSGQTGQVMVQKQHKVIQVATDYIDAHIGESLSLEEMARIVYLSPVYFSKLFKTETGINFSDYVKKARVGRAIVLMQEIRYKIYDICEQVGYKNIRHFYKVFKQVTGMTPTEYRNKHVHPGR